MTDMNCSSEELECKLCT